MLQVLLLLLLPVRCLGCGSHLPYLFPLFVCVCMYHPVVCYSDDTVRVVIFFIYSCFFSLFSVFSFSLVVLPASYVAPVIAYVVVVLYDDVAPRVVFGMGTHLFVHYHVFDLNVLDNVIHHDAFALFLSLTALTVVATHAGA